MLLELEVFLDAHRPNRRPLTHNPLYARPQETRNRKRAERGVLIPEGEGVSLVGGILGALVRHHDLEQKWIISIR